jgi:5'-nucleotidase
MTERPLILFTNDDGIDSPGIYAAAQTCIDLGEILIVAPHEQQSGAGRSMPSRNEGRVYPKEFTFGDQTLLGYGVEGSPAQVVQHALLEFAGRTPDLVIAGINYGENVGEGITVSGTIGAAMEAASLGIPALAVSRQTLPEYHLSHSHDIDFAVAAHFTRMFAGVVLRKGLPDGTDLLKIEVPQSATIDTPIRWTRLSRQRYFVALKPHRRRPTDPGPLGYETRIEMETIEPDSDIQAAIVDQVVAVTPVRLDLTAPLDVAQLDSWFASTARA